MSGSFKTNVHSTDINDQIHHGKFRSVVTVAKNDKFADFNCADAVYGVDDAACIQAALDHISNLGGGHLHITGGHYYCNSQLLYENSNLIMTGDGENTVLDFTGASSGLWCIYIHGDITTTNSLLSSDASVSDIGISVMDGTKFSVGDWIRIRSDALFNNWTQHLGEIQQIKSISGNIITLNETLHSGYLVSDTATVDKMTMLEYITVKNLKIIATNANGNFGIVCAQINNVKIENITSEDIQDRAVYFIDVVSGHMTGCQIKRSNKEALGYGIAIINASRDIAVYNNKFYDCRHGVTCGGDNTYGIQYNQIYGYNSQNFDSQNIGMFGPHPTYDGLTIVGNVCDGSGLGFFNAINTTIVGNSILNCTTVAPIQVPDKCKNIIIANNIIHSLDYRGINITTLNSNVSICNNIIRTAMHGIYSEVAINKINISNNIIDSTLNGIYLRNNGSVAISSDVHIDNNSITSASAGIQMQAYAHNINNIHICNNDITPAANASGIQLWGGDDIGKFTNLTIVNNVCNGGLYGITISSAMDSYIHNNKISGCTTGIHIAKYKVPETNDYTVTKNKISSCTTPINDAANGTAKKITGNFGYITENTGTATIPATTTSIVVSHGLAAAPAKHFAFPGGNLGNCWIDTVTATQMTIHCETAPASDTPVSWSAEV